MKRIINLSKYILALTIFVFVIFTVVFFISGDAFAAVPGCSSANVRWANSSNRIYIEGGGTCTLTDVKTLGSASMPLTLVDPVGKIWHLGANIVIEDGSKLILHGSAVGGDVDELRLKSNNVASSTDNIVFIRADWGYIDMNSTKVTSWDDSLGGPDTEYDIYKRSYIQVRSRLEDLGGGTTTPRESRMDIKASDVGYLGYLGSEKYGLSWKVLGSGSIGPSIFDTVGVYGDIVDSKIHHNYFGIYTYGGEAMTFIDNEINDNIVYGLDPHDDSDFLVIEGNNVHHNGYHGIICSRRCNNLTIKNNISSYNGGNGIMFHRSVTDSLVAENETKYNGDSGIALFESHNNRVATNTSEFNLRGIRLSVGSSDNIIENNIFSDNTKQGIFLYKGSNIPVSGDGRVKSNIFRNNTANDNGLFAARIKESDSNIFENNNFIGNGFGAYLAMGNPTGNIFLNNFFKDNGTKYNIKLFSAPGTIIEGNTIEGSKYGIMISSTVGAMISDNDVASSTNTGIRLQRGSTGNTVTGNTIRGNTRGLDLVDGSNANSVSLNNIIHNTSYAVYIYASDSNILEKNTLTGNSHNFYYAKFDATNTVKDSESFTVKIGDLLSSMTILATDNTIFDSNKNLSTKTHSTSSSILLNQAKVGKARVSFEKFDFTVTPQTDDLLIDVSFWKTIDDLKKKWIASNNSTSTVTASHVVGDLSPGVVYKVLVDGVIVDTLTADPSGRISFNHTDVFLTPKIFIVERI